MKVIIPVAGASYRKDNSSAQPKTLIPIAGKTVLSIIIEQFKNKGVKEFIFIVGHLGDRIEEYIEKKHADIKAYFIHQSERKGIAHAISLTKCIVKNDEIIIVLGDTICEFDVKKFIKHKGSIICVKKVDDPRNFGVVEIDEQDHIIQATEKPAIPISNIAIVGIYKIQETTILFQCIDEILNLNKKSKNTNLTECLSLMLKKHITLNVFRVDNWFDCGNTETLLYTNAILLSKLGNTISKKNPNLKNTVIIPPVSIPANCNIENSIIGPNVTMGDNTTIKNSVINNSIICSYSTIDNAVLKDSFIGSDARVTIAYKNLNIGDNTKIDF